LKVLASVACRAIDGICLSVIILLLCTDVATQPKEAASKRQSFAG
jgi:hypothetical protein